jgi:superfamily II DNA/RNA helicase
MQRRRFARKPRKTIVFISNRKIIDEFCAVSPNSWGFHREIDKPKVALDGFCTATDGIMFCTNAAEHAYDVHNVDEVIYAALPPSLESLGQGTGRADRDRRRALGIVLLGVDMQHKKELLLDDQLED